MLFSPIASAAARIRPPDAAARDAARLRLDTLTKPQGSLGRLEDLAIWLAGVRADPLPVFPRKAVVVIAADHGIVAGGVSAYPQVVTGEMVRNFLRAGAAINVLARQQGATVTVVDAGIVTPVIPPPHVSADRFLERRIGPGTQDFRHGPAMTGAQAHRSIEEGIRIAAGLHAAGLDLLATGDMGIGNTTAAAAVTAAMTALPPEAVVGRGAGIDDAGLHRKQDAVRLALAVNHPDPHDPIDLLAKVGGFEIGMLAGVIIGAAALCVPVVLDGFISGAAALIARGIAPLAIDYCIAGHRSPEPGHAAVLQQLGLSPYLDLGMRLGEGTGAVLAFALVEAATRALREMATFTDAGVSGPA